MLTDILLHVDSYPEATPDAAIDEAVRFAAAFDARLSALAIHIDIRERSNPLAEYLIGLREMAAEAEAQSLSACRERLEHFRQAAQAAGVTGEALIGRANLYAVGDHVAERARTRDLCLVPMAGAFDGQRGVAEAIVFGSGRPVLLYRSGARLPADRFETAIVAWDGSRSAARALADALPILRGAKEVRVLTVTGEKPSAVSGAGADAVRHLTLHGIAAVPEEVEARGRRIGEVLEGYALENKAGVVVMGAYGRSRVREFILGGATEHMLHEPKVPLLLSH